MKRSLLALLGIIILIAPATLFSGDCGDVNNSGDVNIFDITHLISYLYLDGPEPDCGAVFDIDGNVYLTIKIGDQEWMAENLIVTHYRNGDPIPNVIDPSAWDDLTTGAYCEYDNDLVQVAIYGRLYNWFAVNDSRNIAPEGWHVPTDDEWKQLEIYLGMSQADADTTDWRGTDEGGKIKESETIHWQSPNTGATNESGFTALPGGDRVYQYNYLNKYYWAYFWSATEVDGDHAWNRAVNYDHSQVWRKNSIKKHGFSIRCVKD